MLFFLNLFNNDSLEFCWYMELTRYICPRCMDLLEEYETSWNPVTIEISRRVTSWIGYIGEKNCVLRLSHSLSILSTPEGSFVLNSSRLFSSSPSSLSFPHFLSFCLFHFCNYCQHGNTKNYWKNRPQCSIGMRKKKPRVARKKTRALGTRLIVSLERTNIS